VFLVGGFIIFVILSLLCTSLLITTSLEKRGSLISACGMACWGIVGIQFCWREGGGMMDFRMLDHPLYKRSISLEGAGSITAISRKAPKGRKIAWGDLLHEALQALACLSRHLKFKSICCDAVIGFPSAPTTGTVYGYYHATRGVLTPLSCISLHMTPDFDRTIFEGQLSLALEVRYPLVLAARLLRIALRRPVRDFLFTGMSST
jgi:hypothetical protein